MSATEAAIPLNRAALCVDCRLLFHVSRRTCPGCGAEEGWVLVEKMRADERADSAVNEAGSPERRL